jgi:2-iminobutanoate/2-iminopropanoate deaminase
MVCMIVTRVCFSALLLMGCAFGQRKAVQPKEFATERPFSPGVWAGDTLYVAGQIGSDLKTNQIPESFEDEVKTCLNNIGVILKEAGLGYDDVVTVNVYLTDMALFPRMNAVYTTFFREPRPARTTVGVASLVGTAKIEITVTAHKKNAKK